MMTLEEAWAAYTGPLGYTEWAAIFEQGYRAGRENKGRNHA